MADLKALPLAASWTADAAQLATVRPALTDFPTPLVTVSDAAVQHNVTTMQQWSQEHGVSLAPHGKTTMSRQLWQRQLDAGAWGITVATPWQLWQALDWGVPRVMLAGTFVQPAALRAWAARGTAQEVYVWADSLRAVEIMQETLSSASPSVPLRVLVELGGMGGRTGARSVEDALAIAAAVQAASHLTLAGVAGYEGALAHSESAEDLATARAYLEDVARLHHALAPARETRSGSPWLLTAGGSIFFDVVADVLGPLASEPGVEILVRSGAYITHDDGFYRQVTPMNRDPQRELHSAIHGWATVVSRPEPELVLVDGGRRDFPFDEGLPEPQAVRPFGDSRFTPLQGAVATAVNDQHMFLRVPADSTLRVGDVIRFGLSHPCTAFDKWRALPLLDDVDAPDPRVIGLIETSFG